MLSEVVEVAVWLVLGVGAVAIIGAAVWLASVLYVTRRGK